MQNARNGPAAVSRHNLFNFFASKTDSKYPVTAEESVMSQKAHGTSEKPVQKNLRWNCDHDTADRIWYVMMMCDPTITT